MEIICKLLQLHDVVDVNVNAREDDRSAALSMTCQNGHYEAVRASYEVDQYPCNSRHLSRSIDNTTDGFA